MASRPERVDLRSPPAVDLATAMDRVDDGFLALDLDWRVRFANVAASRLLGRESGELLGKSIWEEFPTAVGSTFDVRYRVALATRTNVEFEEFFEELGAWFSIRAYPSESGLTLVFRDVTHLRALMAERRAFLDRLLEAEDRERARIAADVHDDSAQALVVVGLKLDLLRARLGEASPEVTSIIDSLCEQVASATRRLRTLLFSLEPTDAAEPIGESIRTQATHILQDSSIRWSLDDVDSGDELPQAERSQALRITKEALRNVRAHAHASEVRVTIRGDADGVEVAVADDGVAGDPSIFESAPGHRGLATMRDRAAVVGGWCVMEPSSPHGCTVRFYIPRDRP
jgi:signal transduction histidine kinase